MSPQIAMLKEHRGKIFGEATWPRIIDRAIHDRLVGLLRDESRRPANAGGPSVHPSLACSTAGLAVDVWSSTQPLRCRSLTIERAIGSMVLEVEPSRPTKRSEFGLLGGVLSARTQ